MCCTNIAQDQESSTWFMWEWQQTVASVLGLDRIKRRRKTYGRIVPYSKRGKTSPPAEIKELEGIFRHIYRKDSRAARLNVQKSYGKMRKLYCILPRRNGNFAPTFSNM